MRTKTYLLHIFDYPNFIVECYVYQSQMSPYHVLKVNFFVLERLARITTKLK